MRATAALLLAGLAGCASTRPSRGGARARPAAAPVDASVARPPGCAAARAGTACLEAGLSLLGHQTDEARFDERPPRAARLRAFHMDLAEVRTGDYAACVAAGRCTAPACALEGASVPEAPVRCVTWQDATEYCRFRGGRLPTEAEWERAAAGTLPDHRLHPWGDAPAGIDRTPEGVLALGGGVCEWVSDGGGFYLRPPAPRDAGSDADVPDAGERTEAGIPIVDDPRGPEASPWRVARGGHDGQDPRDWTSTVRRFRRPGDRLPWLGFRCVY